MLNKLSRCASFQYIKASVENPWIIDGLINLINLPFLTQIYSRLYYPKILEKISQHPEQIAIETYNICNLKCRMCPYPQMTRAKAKMPMELFKKIVDEASGAGFREINLTMYSEPLLDDLLFERIAYAKSRGLKVGFTSNATLLTHDKIRSILDSRLDWVFFSIDGADKKSYEDIRKGANFESVCANIKELINQRRERKLDKPLIIIHTTVLGRNNIRAARSLERIFKDADCFTTALGDSRKREDFSFTRKSFLKVKHAKLYPCPFVWGAPSVMSNGKVCLCCKDYDGTVELGDLNQQTLQSILNSVKLNKIKQLHLNGEGDKVELCKNCDSLYRASLNWWPEKEVKV